MMLSGFSLCLPLSLPPFLLPPSLPSLFSSPLFFPSFLSLSPSSGCFSSEFIFNHIFPHMKTEPMANLMQRIMFQSKGAFPVVLEKSSIAWARHACVLKPTVVAKIPWAHCTTLSGWGVGEACWTTMIFYYFYIKEVVAFAKELLSRHGEKFFEGNSP